MLFFKKTKIRKIVHKKMVNLNVIGNWNCEREICFFYALLRKKLAQTLSFLPLMLFLDNCVQIILFWESRYCSDECVLTNLLKFCLQLKKSLTSITDLRLHFFLEISVFICSSKFSFVQLGVHVL